MSGEENLIQANIQLLEDTWELIDRMSDALYSNDHSPYFSSGTGKHTRHILDHYDCLLNHRDGRIDYDARKRDPKLESVRSRAMDKIRKVVCGLGDLPTDSDIRVEIKTNEGEIGEDPPWSRSTLKRELQYLESHTVHHQAFIAMILRIQDFEVPSQFGLAPSTLRYLKTSAA